MFIYSRNNRDILLFTIILRFVWNTNSRKNKCAESFEEYNYLSFRELSNDGEIETIEEAMIKYGQKNIHNRRFLTNKLPETIHPKYFSASYDIQLEPADSDEQPPDLTTTNSDENIVIQNVEGLDDFCFFIRTINKIDDNISGEKMIKPSIVNKKFHSKDTKEQNSDDKCNNFKEVNLKKPNNTENSYNFNKLSFYGKKHNKGHTESIFSKPQIQIKKKKKSLDLSCKKRTADSEEDFKYKNKRKKFKIDSSNYFSKDQNFEKASSVSRKIISKNQECKYVGIKIIESVYELYIGSILIWKHNPLYSNKKLTGISNEICAISERDTEQLQAINKNISLLVIYDSEYQQISSNIRMDSETESQKFLRKNDKNHPDIHEGFDKVYKNQLNNTSMGSSNLKKNTNGHTMENFYVFDISEYEKSIEDIKSFIQNLESHPNYIKYLNRKIQLGNYASFKKIEDHQNYKFRVKGCQIKKNLSYCDDIECFKKFAIEEMVQFFILLTKDSKLQKTNYKSRFFNFTCKMLLSHQCNFSDLDFSEINIENVNLFKSFLRYMKNSFLKIHSDFYDNLIKLIFDYAKYPEKYIEEKKDTLLLEVKIDQFLKQLQFYQDKKKEITKKYLNYCKDKNDLKSIDHEIFIKENSDFLKILIKDTFTIHDSGAFQQLFAHHVLAKTNSKTTSPSFKSNKHRILISTLNLNRRILLIYSLIMDGVSQVVSKYPENPNLRIFDSKFAIYIYVASFFYNFSKAILGIYLSDHVYQRYDIMATIININTSKKLFYGENTTYKTELASADALNNINLIFKEFLRLHGPNIQSKNKNIFLTNMIKYNLGMERFYVLKILLIFFSGRSLDFVSTPLNNFEKNVLFFLFVNSFLKSSQKTIIEQIRAINLDKEFLKMLLECF